MSIEVKYAIVRHPKIWHTTEIEEYAKAFPDAPSGNWMINAEDEEITFFNANNALIGRIKRLSVKKIVSIERIL